jgi:hypothetical protein
MAVTAAVCDQFKDDVVAGTAKTTDTYKIALYVAASATLNHSTTAYTATGEVTGTGYTAGGLTLSGYSHTLASGVEEINWSNAVWSSSTITADSALIYDSTNSNHAVAVLSFTSASSSNGTFTVAFPAGGIINLT